MTQMRLVLFAVLALVFAALETTHAQADPQSSKTNPTEVADKRITPKMANEVTDEIVGEIEKLRGLNFKKTVPVKVIDDGDAREYMLARLERFDMRRQMKMTSEAYGLLGLLPAKLDLVETVLEVMREQAGGFYDPGAEVFYLLSDMPTLMLPMITAHELTHALEDQHFDLDARLEKCIDDDDRLFAVSAVHEGSAMVVMTMFSARRMVSGQMDPAELAQQAQAQEAQQKALVGLPPILLRQLLGPYILGAGFLSRGNLMQAFVSGFPTEDVDQAFKAGPLSSEQILHPEKFWEPDFRDLPKDVEILGVEKVLGPRWRRAAAGVLGELALGVLVGAETPAMDPTSIMRPTASWTNLAAAGWGGDRWELWKRGDSAIVVAVVEWDTEPDVQEFVDALPLGGGPAFAHRGKRVALVAGKAGRKKGALLEALLDDGGEAVVSPGRNR